MASLSRSFLHRIFVFTVVILAGISPIYFYILSDLSSTALVVPIGTEVPQSDSKDIAKKLAPAHLILHVGLPKTATSTIQCRLAEIEKKGILSKIASAKIVEIESCRIEKFYHKLLISQYLESFPFSSTKEINNSSLTTTSSEWTTYNKVIKGASSLQHCLDIWIKNHDSVPVPDCWGASYQKYIRNYHHQGLTSFVVSNENLAFPAFGVGVKKETCNVLFTNMLNSLGSEFEIDIVFSHRLHFDRVQSMFGQEYDGKKFYTKPRLGRWPGQEGGDPIPSLENYMSRYPVESIANAIECFRYASRNNPRIHLKVLDFHDKRVDIVTSFLNLVTRNESITAELISMTPWIVIQNENVAGERESRVAYDRIAIAAKYSDILPERSTRRDVRNAVAEYFDAHGLSDSDFKMKCPSDAFFQKLVKGTILVNRAVFPDKPLDIFEKQLRMFENEMFRNLFCEVDGHATLYSDQMRAFVDQYKNNTA